MVPNYPRTCGAFTSAGKSIMNCADSRFNNSVCTGDLDFHESFNLYDHDPVQRKVCKARMPTIPGRFFGVWDFNMGG